MNILTTTDRKSLYAAFCEKQGDVPVFITPWWLDLDAGEENWDVVLAGTGGHITAALPYCFTRLKFFKGIGMPPIAPYQSYYIAYPPDQQKGSSRIAWEQKAVRSLFSGLPPHTFFYQHFPPEITNWMPLYWLGYRQTTKYSYILDDLSRPDQLFNLFEKRARNTIRKAEKSLRVAEEQDSKNLARLITLTFSKQRLKPPYPVNKLARLTESTISKQVGKVYTAFDSEGHAHAAAFVVWDLGRAYYVIQASDPVFLQEGGAALLVWHAIQDASSNGLTSFDFTGSMMPGVEKYIRSFGAVPFQRHYIFKENTVLFYWLARAKEFFGEMSAKHHKSHSSAERAT